MNKELLEIKNKIQSNQVEEAIQNLHDYMATETQNEDFAFYLLGNAYRKKGDWQKALQSYAEAIERNPDSPAAQAKSMLLDILNFYNKDMYNQ